MEAIEFLQIKVTPNAKKNQVTLLQADPDKKTLHLKVTITKSPEKGKANEALIALVADFLKVSKSKLTLVRGHKSKTKLIIVG